MIRSPLLMSARNNYLFWVAHYSLLFLIGLFPGSALGSGRARSQLVSNQVEQQDRLLEEGKPIERELSGGQSHSYRLALHAGQYAHLVIDQRGIDVVVRVMGPDDKETFMFDSEPRLWKQESVSLVGEEGMSYRVNVKAPVNHVAPGKYEIQLVELRPATDDDRALHESRKLISATLGLFRFESHQLAERALEIRERVLGPDHSDVADALQNLGSIYFSRTEYGKAEPLLLRAQEIWEKTLGPDHPLVAKVLNNLALLYRQKGLYAKAEEFNQRSLSIYENALGGEHYLVAKLLNNSAALYHEKGDYDKVESLYQRSLNIVEKTQGRENSNFALLLGNLAELYLRRGDYEKAELFSQRALDICEKVLGSDSPIYASVLHCLADLHRERGNYSKAEPLYLRAMNIWKKNRGPEHPRVALVLNDLAGVYCDEGDYARAEPIYHQALEIYQKVLGQEHPEIANSLRSLAQLGLLRGDYAKAEPLYLRALEIQERMLGPWHPEVATTLYSLALFYATKAEIARAMLFLSLANAVAERNIEINLSFGSERQKLAFLALFSVQTDFTLSLQSQIASEYPEALNLAFTTLLRRKGRGLDEMADTIAALRRRASPKEQVIFTQLADARSQLAALTLRESDASTTGTYRTLFKPLEEEIEQLEAELSALSDRFRAQKQPVTIAAVQAALPAGSALVEFARYTPWNPQSAKSKPPRYLAYLLAVRGQPNWVDLGDAAVIDRTVDAWRKALRDPNRMDVRKLGRTVDEKVMRPVRSLLGETRRLLIAPDGALNLIPFAALVDEQNKYLIERYVISYLTSGRDLLRLQNSSPSRSAPVVIGNPDFGRLLTQVRHASQNSGNTQPGSPGQRRSDQSPIFFQALPSTEDEALSIKAALPETSVLLRKQATEAALKQVRGPHILHIATHGFFLGDQEAPPAKTRGGPGDSPLRLTSLRLSEWAAQIENPLLRSGLALAGANQGRSGGDDGVLTALEAGSLDLWGTKLVTLSACDTGVGVVKNGEGVQGLRRVLVLAGSESQVMSLWPVLDSAAKDLMIAYYKALQRCQGRSDGLRQAQLRMLRSKDRDHPFYWGAFIQSGEWANLDGQR